MKKQTSLDDLGKINLNYAAKNVETFLKECGLTHWEEFRKNPVFVFQLATLYNVSQIIAGKSGRFPDDKLRAGHGPTEREFKHFLKEIRANLKAPKKGAKAAEKFLSAICGTLGNIAVATTRAQDPKSSKRVQSEFAQASDLMTIFSKKLLQDKNIGFGEKERVLAEKLMQNPGKGVEIAVNLIKRYGIEA